MPHIVRIKATRSQGKKKKKTHDRTTESRHAGPRKINHAEKDRKPPAPKTPPYTQYQPRLGAKQTEAEELIEFMRHVFLRTAAGISIESAYLQKSQISRYSRGGELSAANEGTVRSNYPGS